MEINSGRNERAVAFEMPGRMLESIVLKLVWVFAVAMDKEQLLRSTRHSRCDVSVVDHDAEGPCYILPIVTAAPFCRISPRA